MNNRLATNSGRDTVDVEFCNVQVFAIETETLSLNGKELRLEVHVNVNGLWGEVVQLDGWLIRARIALTQAGDGHGTLGTCTAV